MNCFEEQIKENYWPIVGKTEENKNQNYFKKLETKSELLNKSEESE